MDCYTYPSISVQKKKLQSRSHPSILIHDPIPHSFRTKKRQNAHSLESTVKQDFPNFIEQTNYTRILLNTDSDSRGLGRDKRVCLSNHGPFPTPSRCC